LLWLLFVIITPELHKAEYTRERERERERESAHKAHDDIVLVVFY
jgi:hypothetical protein